MNRKELLKFISDNNNDLLLNYYDKTYNKLLDLNKRVDKLTGQLILVVFFYLIVSNSTIQSFQIGPVSFSDISIFIKLLPILFAYLYCDILVTSTHKSEVFIAVKLISLALYKQNIDHRELGQFKNSFITRLLLPFSYTNEISRINYNKVHILQAIIGFLIFLPVIGLFFVPFFFEYYMLKEIYLKYYGDLFGKISFYSTIWIILFTLFYWITNAIQNFKDNKAELT